MAFIGREELLKKEELQIEEVNFENGDFTFVREMNGREKSRFDQSLFREVKTGDQTEYKRDFTDMDAKLAVCTVCDEDGNLVFKPGDVSTLSENIGAKRLATIVKKSRDLNKITEEEKGKMEKNSDAPQDEGSSSDSVES